MDLQCRRFLVKMHWWIQGGTTSTCPQQDPSLSFSHMFLPKSVCVGGWRPPMGNPGSATEMYAKTKELGPIGGGVCPARPPPLDPPMYLSALSHPIFLRLNISDNFFRINISLPFFMVKPQQTNAKATFLLLFAQMHWRI